MVTKMSYFNKFKQTLYKFGDETYTTVFQDISAYVDIIDQVKDNVNFYTYYQIVNGERPDTLSQKIYNTPTLHWVFFLLNDHLRETGWPLTRDALDAKIKKTFPNTTLTTTANLTGIMLPGQTVAGLTSGATATILSRNLDLGQIIVAGSDLGFLQGELITSTVGSTVQSVSLTAAVNQYNSTFTYLDSDGSFVDVDPSVGESAIYIPQTYYEYYVQENDKLSTIKVIKPTTINSVLKVYFEALRS